MAPSTRPAAQPQPHSPGSPDVVPAPRLTPALLTELADTAGELARSVGDVIASMRRVGVDVAATKSSDTDIVTAADREAERLITAGLRLARPDDGILGEEGAHHSGTTGITWVVDPIDGTVNYLYGIPASGVSIAATVADDSPAAQLRGNTADGRRAVAGAVYLHGTDELFIAWEGGGARLNGAPIGQDPNAAPPALGSALVATGFGYTTERRTEQAEVLRRILPRVRDIRRIGAASVDLCFVAAGRLDAYYERGLQPWDYAAGALIAREAGAILLGRDVSALPGEAMLIAAAPTLARELQREVAAAYAALEGFVAERR